MFSVLTHNLRWNVDSNGFITAVTAKVLQQFLFHNNYAKPCIYKFMGQVNFISQQKELWHVTLN